MVGFLIALSVCLRAAAPFMSGVPAKFLQPAPAGSQVVASVDGVAITAKDVEDFLWQWRGADAARDLVEFQLIKAEADRRSVSATPAEIEAKLKVTLDAFKQQSPGKDVDDILQQQGFTRSRAYLRIARQVLLEKMVEPNYHAADFIKVSAITIKPGPTKSLEQALGEAEAAHAKLVKGVKWNEVLATTTSDPNILQEGGLLGWRTLKIFPESTAKEMVALKAGGFTKAVQTTAGVQIFRVEAKGDQIPTDQAAELKNEFITNEVAKLDREIHAKAKIVNYQPAKRM